MTTNLIEIGNHIRDAYAASNGEGTATWLSYGAPGLQVFHVPELPGDGTPFDPTQLGDSVGAEADALEKIHCRIDVQTVRQLGDDTLALETVFTGVLPDGNDFRYTNVLIYTFRDGRIVRLVEVASEDMWSTLSKALADAAGYTGAAARD
jgi:ketosteroid isomerase-like protein